MNEKKAAGKKKVPGKKKVITPDIAVKNYWNGNSEFADLFNAVLFRGEDVIRPEDLTADDTGASVFLEDKTGKPAESIHSERDTLKVCRRSAAWGGVQLVILGLESQEKVHYAMPLRVMGYDYGNYKKQYDANARDFMEKYKTKELGSVTDAEYLSKMKRTDRFVPVVTVVIYYGEKPWDGAVSLHGILEIPEEMKPFVNDYKIILVEARRNDLAFHNVNNRDLFYLFQLMMDKDIPHAEKKKEFQKYCDEHQTSREVLVTLAGAMNMKLDDRVFEKEDKSVSCTFIEELLAEGRAEGRAEGIVAGRTEGRAEGEAKMSTLILRLTDLGRSEEIVRAAEDKGYQKKLFREFGL